MKRGWWTAETQRAQRSEEEGGQSAAGWRLFFDEHDLAGAVVVGDHEERAIGHQGEELGVGNDFVRGLGRGHAGGGGDRRWRVKKCERKGGSEPGAGGSGEHDVPREASAAGVAGGELRKLRGGAGGEIVVGENVGQEGVAVGGFLNHGGRARRGGAGGVRRARG